MLSQDPCYTTLRARTIPPHSGNKSKRSPKPHTSTSVIIDDAISRVERLFVLMQAKSPHSLVVVAAAYGLGFDEPAMRTLGGAGEKTVFPYAVIVPELWYQRIVGVPVVAGGGVVMEACRKTAAMSRRWGVSKVFFRLGY